MTEIIVVSSGQMSRHIEVPAGESKDMVLLVYPGVSCDIVLDIELQGEGAQANVYGAYVCGAEERVKIAVDMHHRVPHCCSRQLFKGIAGGTSKVDFYGKIIVAQDAQKTEAYQENHNILLSDGAKVDTKPQLEIYHGGLYKAGCYAADDHHRPSIYGWSCLLYGSKRAWLRNCPCR